MDKRTAAILHERAVKLSRPLKSKNAQKDDLEVIEFSLGSERYAIESIYIREVHPIKEVTTLPGTPNFLYGLMNVRRKVVPVINLKSLFDMERHEVQEGNRAIILRGGGKEFGVLADRVIGIKKIVAVEMESTLPTLQGVRHQFLKGICPDSLVILDGGKLIASDTLVIDERN